MSEKLARKFHEVYERLAPSHGYETREETRCFDPKSPNGRLMIRVCGEVCGEQQDEIERLQAKVERLTKRGLQDLNWQNDELHEENERLRELLKGVLDAASPQKRWDVLMLEIEKELANE